MPLWHKLMVYTSEGALHDGQPIHRAIVRELRAAGIAGTTTCEGSGASTATTRRTATGCSSSAGACPRSRS